MSDTKRGDRVRVVIAGNIYTKRALVKRFLADDGFRVVAEAATRPELGAALDSTDPDAVVVDDGLLADDAAIAAIRRKVPSAKIVVFTSGPAQKPMGADGYLEKGVGLATLTALLVRLCSDPTVSMSTVPLAGVVDRAAESPAGPTSPEPSSERDSERRAPRSAPQRSGSEPCSSSSWPPRCSPAAVRPRSGPRERTPPAALSSATALPPSSSRRMTSGSSAIPSRAAPTCLRAPTRNR